MANGSRGKKMKKYSCAKRFEILRSTAETGHVSVSFIFEFYFVAFAVGKKYLIPKAGKKILFPSSLS